MQHNIAGTVLHYTMQHINALHCNTVFYETLRQTALHRRLKESCSNYHLRPQHIMNISSTPSVKYSLAQSSALQYTAVLYGAVELSAAQYILVMSSEVLKIQ